MQASTKLYHVFAWLGQKRKFNPKPGRDEEISKVLREQKTLTYLRFGKKQKKSATIGIPVSQPFNLMFQLN